MACMRIVLLAADNTDPHADTAEVLDNVTHGTPHAQVVALLNWHALRHPGRAIAVEWLAENAAVHGDWRMWRRFWWHGLGESGTRLAVVEETCAAEVVPRKRKSTGRNNRRVDGDANNGATDQACGPLFEWGAHCLPDDAPGGDAS